MYLDPKHKVGDVVFFCQKDPQFSLIIEGTIESIIVGNNSTRYFVRYGREEIARGFDEEDIFTSFGLAKIEMLNYMSSLIESKNK